MAVESRHINFVPVNMTNPYNNYGLPPLSGTTTDSFIPVFNNNNNNNNGAIDSFSVKGAVKSDSGLTYAYNNNLPRKRSRESVMMGYVNNGQVLNGNRCGGSFTFLGDDVSLQIQHQQLEMDRLIAQHNDKVRMEIEERRKIHSRRIIAAVEESITKRLKAKDDEIERMVKLNWALEEKAKSLSMEAQIWRDLAHSNEAAAHTLRANLEQVLDARGADVTACADDAESCCDSNSEGEERERRERERRMCRHCGEGVSSVLMLPCRHLCLCTVCGSSVHVCPLCNIPKEASVQVIMSS